jgi:hypothetical protein
VDEWTLPNSEQLLRRSVRERLVQPWRERSLLFERYDAFLGRLLADERIDVVPLAELARSAEDRITVALRHDVDFSLDAALTTARLEHARGIRATYYILHTAPYYDEEVLPALRTLQDDYGHEVGWHNDLVTLQCVNGVDARAYLARELARLRSAGIDVRGVAAHGSYWGHRLGYDNTYFFSDFDEVTPAFPNREVVRGVTVPKGTLAEFGFAYDANHLAFDRFYSDARYDRAGLRWTPDALDLASLVEGERAVLLVHPDHWDASLAVKVRRHYARGAVRSVQLLWSRLRRRS